MQTLLQFPDFINNFPEATLPPGVNGRTTFLGAEAGQAVFHTIPKGQGVPLHRHKDSWACLVSGSLKISLGDEQFVARTGMSWFIPEGTMHGGTALEDTLLLEVFCEQRFSVP
jgi:quercetin dioxygenase-like cupin family protein